MWVVGILVVEKAGSGAAIAVQYISLRRMLRCVLLSALHLCVKTTNSSRPKPQSFAR